MLNKRVTWTRINVLMPVENVWEDWKTHCRQYEVLPYGNQGDRSFGKQAGWELHKQLTAVMLANTTLGDIHLKHFKYVGKNIRFPNDGTWDRWRAFCLNQKIAHFGKLAGWILNDYLILKLSEQDTSDDIPIPYLQDSKHQN